MPSKIFSDEMIFLIAFDAKPVEFRVQTANALKDGQVAGIAERFANQFRLHAYRLPHYPTKIKPKFASLAKQPFSRLNLKIEDLLLFSVAKWHAAC
jgi:hypothetical protein